MVDLAPEQSHFEVRKSERSEEEKRDGDGLRRQGRRTLRNKLASDEEGVSERVCRAKPSAR